MTYVADQRAFFDELISEQWHTYHSPDWAYGRRLEVKELFRIVQPSRVLDIGCGCGFHDLEMAKYEFVTHIDAIDYSPKSIERAGQEYPHAKTRYITADLNEWSGGDYDLVVSFQVFEHLEDPDSYFAKCKSLLRKGGTIGIVMPNFDSLNNRLREKRGLQREFVDPLHFKEYTRAGVTEIAHRHGLKEIGHFGQAYSSQFAPLISKLPYQVRAHIGRLRPAHAGIIGSVFR